MNKRNSGFTLIEMMVTIVIAIVLMSVAIPSFKAMIESTRLSTDANNLLMAMLLARSEATKSGLSVVVAPTAPALGWGGGFFISYDYDNDGVYRETFLPAQLVTIFTETDGIDKFEEEVRQWPSNSSMGYDSDISKITYLSDGTVELNTGDMSDVISLQPLNCEEAAGRRRNLKFSNTGQVRVVKADCEAL